MSGTGYLLSTSDQRLCSLLFDYLTWFIAEKEGKSDESPDFSQSDLFELRKNAFRDKQAITRYLSGHAGELSEEEHVLFRRLDHCIVDTFVLISVKKDALHLLYNPPGDSYILEVTPWSKEAVANFKELGSPRLVEAALFPSDTGIIYDLLSVKSISFGSGITKNIKAESAVAKAKHGVITSLPIPVSTEDKDLVLLRGLMCRRESILQNWEDIQMLIRKKPELMTEYYQKLGGAYTRIRRKELKENGVFGWFALYGWVVIAGGKSREIAESAAQSLLTQEEYDRLVLFEVKK